MWSRLTLVGAMLAAWWASESVTLAEPSNQSGAWIPTALTEETYRLITPQSGAFFAVVNNAVLRSNDGGTTWASVNLPPQRSQTFRPQLAVTPTDHTRLFAMGEGGLYRSTDDAASWTLVLPSTREARNLAVSAADPHVVYAGLAPPAIAVELQFFRSRDGGNTWEQLEDHRNSLCGWGMPVLQPHASDPGRVFRIATCYAGRTIALGVDQLRDFSTSWTGFYAPGLKPYLSEHFGGGAAEEARRYYVAGRQDPRSGGGPFLARTDDDGATWTVPYAQTGFTTPNSAAGPEPLIRGLTMDPRRPDRVYLAISTVSGKDGNRTLYAGTVLVSDDAGITFQPLGAEDLGDIKSLALGIDGHNLYAATGIGVWRYGLAIPEEAAAL